MLADQQNPFDGQLPAAVGKSLGNGARDPKAVLTAQGPSQIIVRRLIDVEGADVMAWDMETAGAGVALDKSAGDMVRMGQRPIDGGEHSNRLTPFGTGFRRASAEGLG